MNPTDAGFDALLDAWENWTGGWSGSDVYGDIPSLVDGMAAAIRALIEERNSWRRVAERLEGEKQNAANQR